MRTNLPIRLLCLGFIVVLAACSQQPSGDASSSASSKVTVAADAAATASPADGGGNGAVGEDEVGTGRVSADVASQLQSSTTTYTDAQREFILTASAEFQVRDVVRSALAIEDLVAAHGGFIASNAISSPVGRVQSRSTGEGKLVELATYNVRGALKVRVPSGRTQGFLRALAGQIEFLDRRSFEAVDAQFELLRQRLARQRLQQAQLALGQVTDEGGKLAQKTDAIAARNDALAGRDEALIAQKTFEDQVAFATIDLSLYQAAQIRRTERLDVDAAIRREGPGFFARVGDSFAVGWYGLLSVLVAALTLWPLWLGLLAAIVLVRRWRRN